MDWNKGKLAVGCKELIHFKVNSLVMLSALQAETLKIFSPCRGGIYPNTTLYSSDIRTAWKIELCIEKRLMIIQAMVAAAIIGMARTNTGIESRPTQEV